MSAAVPYVIVAALLVPLTLVVLGLMFGPAVDRVFGALRAAVARRVRNGACLERRTLAECDIRRAHRHTPIGVRE